MKKLRVRDIGPNGLIVDDIIQPDVMGKKENGELLFVEPLKVKLLLELADREIISKINISGIYSTFCYRCLFPINPSLEKSMVLSFEANRSVEFFDIEEEIRQEILLDLPVRDLCSNDCKGLCQFCGANLNESECKCSKAVN